MNMQRVYAFNFRDWLIVRCTCGCASILFEKLGVLKLFPYVALRYQCHYIVCCYSMYSVNSIYFTCGYFTADTFWLLLINVISLLSQCFLSSFSSPYQHLHDWQYFTNLIILQLCIHEKFSFHKSLTVSFQFSTHSLINRFSKEFNQLVELQSIISHNWLWCFHASSCWTSKLIFLSQLSIGSWRWTVVTSCTISAMVIQIT